MKRIICSTVGAAALAAIGVFVLAPTTRLGAQGATCSVNGSEVGTGAATPGTVLVLQTSVTGGCSSSEATQAMAVGYNVEVATPLQWSLKNQDQFASYRAIVLGDPTCSTSTSSIAAAEANRATWSPAVSGNVVLLGTDPSLHGRHLVAKSGIRFAADEAGKTGAYITLSCYYHSAPSGTAVPLLDQFGSFTVVGQGGCPEDSHIVAAHPALAELTDDYLSNWGCSTHEGFVSWPDSFLVLAISEDVPSPYVAGDGTTGAPYILARGEDVVPAACGDGNIDPGEQCDDGNTTSGDGCSAQCKIETDLDSDDDGIFDSADNCPTVANADQADADEDGQGDACDADDDNDGVPDETDNCVRIYNPDQADADGDGVGNACDADDDNDGVSDDSDNCVFTANPDQADADDDGVGDACDNCAAFYNPGQEDGNEDGVGDACRLAGEGGDGEAEQVFPPGSKVEREYRATVPGQDEPETFVLSFDSVLNPLVCTVNFRLVLLAEEAPRLAKINAARALAGKAPVTQLEYRTHDDSARGYGVRYEVECQVDTNGDGTGDRQAIPGQDYNRPNIAFTFHAHDIQQFDIAQERTLQQDGSGAWVPEADVPLDQYDRLLSSLGPVHLAKSSCDCVGSAGTLDLSWFIAVTTELEDPDGGGPAGPGDVALIPVLPAVKNGNTFWNPLRRDGTFKAGLPIIFTVRLRNTVTGAYIRDPDIKPPSESGLVATIKRVIEGDVDKNVPLEGFLRFWGDDGGFRIDLLRKGYYTYVWQTVQQDTWLPLPPGKYTVTIASKYTVAQPFVINLR
jgi:cysteine-rich repeat protein